MVSEVSANFHCCSSEVSSARGPVELWTWSSAVGLRVLAVEPGRSVMMGALFAVGQTTHRRSLVNLLHILIG